jgi:hypothetical protein
VRTWDTVDADEGERDPRAERAGSYVVVIDFA